MSFCKHRVDDKCKKDGKPCIYSKNCVEAEEKVPVTNVERFRTMTDEELVEFLFEHGADTICDLVCGGGCMAIDSFKETAAERCRRIILEKLRAPYKEKEHGQTIGADAEA